MQKSPSEASCENVYLSSEKKFREKFYMCVLNNFILQLKLSKKTSA